jgi:tetratricopeptide (TPR) repeat protein
MKKFILIFFTISSFCLNAQTGAEKYGQLYNQAVEEISKQNFDNAIKLLDHAIELKKDYAEAYFARGTSYLMLNQRAKACKDLYKAKELEHWQADEYIEKYCSRHKK